MEHNTDTLLNILLIILSAVFVVAIFKKLKLSPVLGYFVAGSIIGENGREIVSSRELEFFGEIGVVFLLFAIGLELTFERLKAMRKHVFGFGSAQVLLTGLAIFGISRALGLSHSAAIIIGGGLALSSTAIVLQVIAENREQSTQVGRLSLAVLLMQDFAVVPLLVILPILGGEQSAVVKSMGEAILKAVLVLVMIFIIGRAFLRPVFHTISSSNSAKSNELFIATTLLIALGAAWATDFMGLSLALGAFVAGLLVAETEFQLQAEESIAPFKALLLGLFFMTVGMTINLKLAYENLSLIAFLSIAIILVKAVIIALLSVAFRFSWSVATHTGLLLAQGGEFAFILFRLASEQKIINDSLGQMLLLVVTITMAFTPLLGYFGKLISSKLDKSTDMAFEKNIKEIADLDNHVIILGFGRVGKMVARLLEAENVNYVAVDIDPEHVAEQRKDGFPLYLGDSSNIRMLKSVGIERCSSVIIAMENKMTLLKSAKAISQIFPYLPIVARSADLSRASEYYDAGVKVIVPETYETGLQLGGAVLKSIGISEFEVSRIKNQFRAGNYIRLPKQDEDEATD
jgi:CPA2 family monovalent cation:H+ antiporter-2